MKFLKSKWFLILGLAMGVAISNGFARFAYGLILPAMQQDLSWTYAQAGWINTANALGYLAGAILTFMLVSRFSPAMLFVSGILGTSFSLIFSGLTMDFWLLSLFRITAGMFGAPVFIIAGMIASNVFPGKPAKNALAVAICFGGGGFGMVLSGASLPYLFELAGSGAWPEAWLLLGITSAALTFWSIYAAYVLTRTTKVEPDPVHIAKTLPVSGMLYELCGYGLFATGYIVYLTFLVAWMANLPASAHLIASVWVLIGSGIMISPFVWKPVMARFQDGTPLSLSCAVIALAVLISAIIPTVTGLLLSGFMFGLAVFIAPGAVTLFSKNNLPEELWGKAVSLFTVIFALGQSLGPIAAGFISDYTGSLSSGLLCAAAIVFLATILASRQPALNTV